MMISRAMGARKPGSQGERAISVKTIAQGMPDVLAEPVVTAACLLFGRRAMGAASTRHSLRPHLFRGPGVQHGSGEFRRENVESCLEKVWAKTSVVITREKSL